MASDDEIRRGIEAVQWLASYVGGRAGEKVAEILAEPPPPEPTAFEKYRDATFALRENARGHEETWDAAFDAGGRHRFNEALDAAIALHDGNDNTSSSHPRIRANLAGLKEADDGK